MSRRPGTVLRLPDGRKAIMYDLQPLKKLMKTVLHLVDENMKPVLNESQSQKTVIKDSIKEKEWLSKCILVGKVD